MKNKTILPFQDMTPVGWANLAMASVLLFYVLQVGFDLFSHNMCGNLAMDYCAYWSVGRIASTSGYVDIYDLDLLTQFQRSIHPQANNPSIPFQVEPVPYLPIFVVPFQFLSSLSLESGFLAWTLLNLLGFISYMHFFSREMTGYSLPARLVLLVLLSLPVFLNLFWGQVNIFLGICGGEFIRGALSNKPFRAGLWLGGWLLKPQLLILIIPVLLVQRSIRAVAGFAVSMMAILMISFGLVGTEGLLTLLGLFLGFAKGMPTNGPEIMMNWRMLGLHIASLASPIVGRGVTVIGTMLTACALLVFLRRPIHVDHTKDAIALIGILAATGAVAWHAHFSMAIVLIPPMVLLYIRKRFPEKLLLFWVFMPTVAMLLIYVLAAFIRVGILPLGMAEFLDLLAGLRGLVLNLAILAWAVIEYSRNPLSNEGLVEG